MAMDVDDCTSLLQVLGGTNDSLYHGDIFYTPIVQESFYNVLLTNISVGKSAIDLDCSEVAMCLHERGEGRGYPISVLVLCVTK